MEPLALAPRMEELKEISRSVLDPIPSESLFLRLARFSRRWLDRHDPFRIEAEERLPEATGFSGPMIRRALDETFGPLDAPALTRLAGVAPGPRATLVVAAGAIPDPVVRSVYRSLLGRSAVLVKASAADPVLPELLARSLADLDPSLGRLVAGAYWTGGAAGEEEIYAAAERIVAYGSDEALREITRRVPSGCPFVAFGHRVSVALVGSEALARTEAVADLGRRLALDVALYDGRGCLSPQAVWVEDGGRGLAEGLAAAIAHHLGRLTISLPRGRVSALEGSRIVEERARSEMAGWPVWSGPGTSWTVVVDREPGFRPSPPGRFLRILPIDDPATALPSIQGLPLQAVASAPLELGERLGLRGVRICPPGTLQTPPVEWLER